MSSESLQLLRTASPFNLHQTASLLAIVHRPTRPVDMSALVDIATQEIDSGALARKCWRTSSRRLEYSNKSSFSPEWPTKECTAPRGLVGFPVFDALINGCAAGYFASSEKAKL